MPTRRVEMNGDHLAEAKAAADARGYTSRDPLIFAHVGERGLQLRVQDSTASWVLKFNGRSKGIGKLSEVKTVKAAVQRAQAVRAIMKRGEDPAEYLKSLAVTRDHQKATADVRMRKAREEGAWTWKQLADAYVAEYLSQPKQMKSGIKPPSERSVKDFRRYTSTPHHTLINDILVKDLTPELIEKVRNDTKETNGPNAARKVVQWVSSALTWGQAEHKLETRLGTGFPWWKAVSPGYRPPTRNRYLTLEQIARVLYVAEKYRTLPDRKQKKATDEATLAALWWLALCAQRTGARMKLLASNVVADKGMPGWSIAAFPAEDMKSRRYHALPLPPLVGLLLQRARTSREWSSIWAFPSKKQRRPGSKEVEDLHVHDTTVNQLIRRLRGQDDTGKKLGSPDLLAGVPEFSPHDIRKSLTTILADMKVRGDAASAVLDHSTATPDSVEFREADITRLAYNKSQRIELKREAMTTWTDALFEAVEAEWMKHQPKSPPKFFPINPLVAVGHPDRWWVRMMNEAVEEDTHPKAAGKKLKLSRERVEDAPEPDEIDK